jgi:tritrans,polycis-undecaprenyl-diphosphate synthase [geranylgeranyl-diphosphate specific]
MNPLQKILYRLYERRLEKLVKSRKRPRHLAIILDGNRRWAEELRLSANEGHRKGFENVVRVIRWAQDLDIRELTVFAFSTENFERDRDEVEGLMDLLVEACEEFGKDPDIHRDRVRIRAIGRVELLPERVRKAIDRIEKATGSYDRFHLNIAVAYGGRAEIVDAIKKLYHSVEKGEKSIDEITEEDVTKHLYKEDMIDPDMIIRTSGEQRLSGFLLWQSAYAELYFEEAYFPSFRKIDFLRALRTYQNRARRFGK